MAATPTVLHSLAHARDSAHQCGPSELPNALGQTGAVAIAQPVAYMNDAWLLAMDKATRPTKVRLVSASGQVVALGRPPATVQPMQWLARGRGVYAVGPGRSLTNGKTDVVLMRYGIDPRPRLTVLSTIDALQGVVSAAFSKEFMAVTWAQKTQEGGLRRLVSFVDVEELRVRDPIELGPDAGSAASVQANNGRFDVLWMAPQGLMHAQFDKFGKPGAPVATLALAHADPVHTVLQCGEHSWSVGSAGNELVFAASDGQRLTERARLPLSAGDALSQVQCVGDAIAVGRRTVDAKASNVTFWISTVNERGKISSRRIKDMRGSGDDIRIPQLAYAGDALTSWWVEGTGANAKLWSRAIRCR